MEFVLFVLFVLCMLFALFALATWEIYKKHGLGGFFVWIFLLFAGFLFLFLMMMIGLTSK